MNYILFDDQLRTRFLPFSYTRPVSDLFFGGCSNTERWEQILNAKVSFVCPDYLQKKFPVIVKDENILINGRFIPNAAMLKEIESLKLNEKLVGNDEVLAVRMNERQLNDVLNKANKATEISGLNFMLNEDLHTVTSVAVGVVLQNSWDLFQKNGDAIKSDSKLLNSKDFKGKGGVGNTLIGDEVFIHSSAIVNASVLNSTNGPIIIDEGAEIMEGSLIRGPVYIGKHAVVKMGAKIYGATSIGNYSKVGGEINNCVVFDFSNKAHDGFIGNSVIGSWCNLGADTNTSNLKNDYSIVKLWSFEKGIFDKTGQQFLGLMMGDHSKCGINTMFNTGTVVGVSCNIFGAGFLPNFIPSFSWGKAGGFVDYQLEKATEVANRVMQRRDLQLDGQDLSIFKFIFEQTIPLREKFN